MFLGWLKRKGKTLIVLYNVLEILNELQIKNSILLIYIRKFDVCLLPNQAVTAEPTLMKFGRERDYDLD